MGMGDRNQKVTISNESKFHARKTPRTFDILVERDGHVMGSDIISQ